MDIRIDHGEPLAESERPTGGCTSTMISQSIDTQAIPMHSHSLGHSPAEPSPESLSMDKASTVIHSLPMAGVYASAGDALHPALIRMLEPIPWIPIDRDDASGGFQDARHLWRHTAAATALGLRLERAGSPAERSQRLQIVRAALVRWQYALRGDGVPVDRRHRADTWHAMAAANVTTLLCESSEFHTDSLLADLARHLRWLARRPYLASWKEATFIAALADAAIITRDNWFTGEAHRRLARLLATQSSEGWFPEGGGPDLGLLSLSIDALARMRSQHGTAPVADALARACRFLDHFVEPGGIPGGAVNARGTQFLSPYGLELSAADLAPARRTLLLLRPLLERLAVDETRRYTDDLAAMLAVRLALAESCAAQRQPPQPPVETIANSTNATDFPSSGWKKKETPAYRALINVRQGGALRIDWKESGISWQDCGVTVVFSNSVRISGRWSAHTRAAGEGRSERCAGPLHHPRLLIEPDRHSFLVRFGKWLRSALFPATGTTDRPSPAHLHGFRYALGHFSREVEFDDDAVRITDLVETVLPSVAILVQLPFAAVPPAFRLEMSATKWHQPLCFDGGCRVELRRTYRRGVLTDCTRTLLK